MPVAEHYTTEQRPASRIKALGPVESLRLPRITKPEDLKASHYVVLATCGVYDKGAVVIRQALPSEQDHLLRLLDRGVIRPAEPEECGQDFVTIKEQHRPETTLESQLREAHATIERLQQDLLAARTEVATLKANPNPQAALVPLVTPEKLAERNRMIDELQKLNQGQADQISQLSHRIEELNQHHAEALARVAMPPLPPPGQVQASSTLPPAKKKG